MDSLQKILSELKREVTVALSANEPLPGNVKLEPERVVVNVGFSFKPDSKELCFDESRWVAGKPSHSISIEFKLSSKEQASTDLQALHSKPLNARTVEDVVAELTKVLGKPGFDSSARATVLREACENLSAEDLAKLFENVAKPNVEWRSGEVKSAYSLIQRVCRSGPAGDVEGRRILAQVFQTWDVASVLSLIAETWKTQDQWI